MFPSRKSFTFLCMEHIPFDSVALGFREQSKSDLDTITSVCVCYALLFICYAHVMHL